MTAPGQVTGTAQDEAANVAGTAKDEAANVASTAKGEAANVAGTAKAEASNVLGETAAQVKDLTGQVREQASQQLGTQSEKLTGSLRGLSQQLADGDTSGVVGQVLGEVGQRVQTVADHLERVGPQGLLEDVRDYARRNPGTFLIGMAAAGFLAGRLTKGLTGGSSSSTTSSGAGYPVYPESSYEGAALLDTGYGTSGTAGYGGTAYGDAALADPSLTDPASVEPGYGGTGWAEPLGSPLPDDTRTRGAL